MFGIRQPSKATLAKSASASGSPQESSSRFRLAWNNGFAHCSADNTSASGSIHIMFDLLDTCSISSWLGAGQHAHVSWHEHCLVVLAASVFSTSSANLFGFQHSAGTCWTPIAAWIQLQLQ